MRCSPFFWRASPFFFMSKIMTEEKIETQNDALSDNEAARSIFACWNDALRQMTTFKGRTSRYEFWAFQSVSLVIFLLSVFCGQMFGEPKIIINIFALYFLLPATSAAVRRLHDLGMSGWWWLPALLLLITLLVLWNLGNFAVLPFLLFAALIYCTFVYWVLCGRGQITENKYGNVIAESKGSNLDSRAFMCFIFAFLIGLWAIFLTHIW